MTPARVDRPDPLGGARAAPAGDAGELLGGRLRGARPRAGRGQLRARRRVRPGARDDRRLRQGAQAVRRARRRLPGGLAPLRADAARHREGARDDGVRGVDRRRRPASGWPRRRRWPRPRRRTPGREVTASAIQAHGGIGFTWEADVHWLYKRAQLDAALLGGAKRHRARLAAILREKLGNREGSAV